MSRPGPTTSQSFVAVDLESQQQYPSLRFVSLRKIAFGDEGKDLDETNGEGSMKALPIYQEDNAQRQRDQTTIQELRDEVERLEKALTQVAEAKLNSTDC